MEPHAYRRQRAAAVCEVCGSLPGAVVHLIELPGLEKAEPEREEARGLFERMELEERMRTVKADISAKAGDMERNAPLFYGTGSTTLLCSDALQILDSHSPGFGRGFPCLLRLRHFAALLRRTPRPRISAHADPGGKGGGGGGR